VDPSAEIPVLRFNSGALTGSGTSAGTPSRHITAPIVPSCRNVPTIRDASAETPVARHVVAPLGPLSATGAASPFHTHATPPRPRPDDRAPIRRHVERVRPVIRVHPQQRREHRPRVPKPALHDRTARPIPDLPPPHHHRAPVRHTSRPRVPIRRRSLNNLDP